MRNGKSATPAVRMVAETARQLDMKAAPARRARSSSQVQAAPRKATPGASHSTPCARKFPSHAP